MANFNGLLPTLKWIPSFVFSIQMALGSSVSYDLTETVNPLVYRFKLKFSEPMAGKNIMLIWNMLQMYSATNDSIIQGRVKGHEFEAEIGVKRLQGKDRDKCPS
jgi:hypothetical protein